MTMSWAKLDDRVTFHPKIVSAGNTAVGIWLRMITYSCAQRTDGFVPESVARMIGSSKEIERTAKHELIHRVDGGYLVHDFHEYNPTSDDDNGKKDKRAESGRIGGIKSGIARRSKNEANASKQNEANASIDSKHDASTKSNPVPSRPVLPEEKTNTHARVRGPESLAAKFDRICGVSMPDAQTTVQARDLIAAYADSTGREFDDCANDLLAEFVTWVGGWDGNHAATPHLLVKHFDTVQGLVGKKRRGATAIDRLTQANLAARGDA